MLRETGGNFPWFSLLPCPGGDILSQQRGAASPIPTKEQRRSDVLAGGHQDWLINVYPLWRMWKGRRTSGAQQ